MLIHTIYYTSVITVLSQAVRQRGLRKGIKLDFKDIDVVQKSIQVLQKFEVH